MKKVPSFHSRVSLTILASLFILSYNSPQATRPKSFSAPAPLNDGLQTARPRDVALDEDILTPLVKRLQTNAIRNLHSLLILRHDHLVLGEYFNGSSRNDVHTLQSVTNSVASLLIGAAIQRQALEASTSRS